MAYAPEGYSASEFTLEVSTDGSTWSDISANAKTIEISGGERGTEDTKVAGADAPIVSAGKRSSQEAEVNMVYTQGASDGFALIRTSFEAGTPLYMRYTPTGGSSNAKRFFSADKSGTAIGSVVLNCPPPSGDVDEDGIMMATATFRASQFKEEAVP